MASRDANIDRWFHGFFQQGGVPWVPVVKVTRLWDGIEYRIAVPGASPEGVNIEVHGDHFVITVESDGIPSGVFQGAYRIPSEVEIEAVEAVHRNGALEVFFPLAA